MALTDVKKEDAELYLHAKAKLGEDLKTVGFVEYTGLVTMKLIDGGGIKLAPASAGTRSLLGSGGDKKDGLPLELVIIENFTSEDMRRRRTMMEIGGNGAAPYQASVWRSAVDFFTGSKPSHSGLVDRELEKHLGLDKPKKFIERYPGNDWYLPGENKI